MLVARNDKGVLYHLSDLPASGSGSYSGYTIVEKAVQTQQFVNYGRSHDVPLIGDDEDAYAISSSEIFVIPSPRVERIRFTSEDA